MKTRKLINILFILVMLCQLVITSCSNNNETKETEIPVSENEIPKAWNMNLSTYKVDVAYELPEYSPKMLKNMKLVRICLICLMQVNIQDLQKNKLKQYMKMGLLL